MSRTPDPAQDGTDFINVYHNGKTRLGRLLTNPADVPVNHPRFGRFRTMEGLYFYMITDFKHEDLRSMNGFEAREFGKSITPTWFDDKDYEVKVGIRCKIDQHPELRQLVEESILPFEHFYVYPNRVVVPKSSKKFCAILEQVRADILNGVKYD